jgi:hypothetical protein
MPYIIQATGGHLTTARYVHTSGLFTANKNAAERFDELQATENIRLNTTSACTFEALFVLDEQTCFDIDEAFPELKRD